MRMTDRDWEELKEAKDLLEGESLAMRITRVAGAPIEKGFKLLPEKWSGYVQTATRKSLQRALHVAFLTLKDRPERRSTERFYRLSVGISGGLGGAFGLAGLAVELPVSTVLVLRSILEVARNQGEDLASVETRLACLEVFALGGRPQEDDAAETAYYAVRTAMAKAVTDAARYITETGLAQEGAPALVRLITAIAARFGVLVSEKTAAAAIPIVGAAGGALLNEVFLDHFLDVARGHFTVRRLERAYGKEVVREAYEQA
ncbi:MAG: EcsC family protein [bacterium]